VEAGAEVRFGQIVACYSMSLKSWASMGTSEVLRPPDYWSKPYNCCCRFDRNADWQDLAFSSFAIKIAYVFERDFRFCVPTLFPLGKRWKGNVRTFVEREL
jgi:hypothetical protein